MLANPKMMVEKGFVKNLFSPEKQIQPNAIDFTVDVISKFNSTTCWVNEQTKHMRQQERLECSDGGNWHLAPNSSYDVSSNVYVEVPPGKAALLILRSTFVRNGLILTSGLYDSGFKGNIGAVLHTMGANIAIAPGTRIGQIMFIDSDSAGMYAGGYNTVDGQHWTEKGEE